MPSDAWDQPAFIKMAPEADLYAERGTRLPCIVRTAAVHAKRSLVQLPKEGEHGPYVVHFVDERTGNVLCRLYPQDKTKNASGLRRSRDPDTREPATQKATEIPALLRKMLDLQAFPSHRT